MVLFETFAVCKSGSAIEQRNFSTLLVSKEPIDVILTFNNDSDWPLSPSISLDDEIPVVTSPNVVHGVLTASKQITTSNDTRPRLIRQRRSLTHALK